jgi:SAM-dependent methyltransferase
VEDAIATERHWEHVHETKAPEETSWFEPSPESSLRLIEALELDPAAAIVDVGGGASRLAARLLDRGFADLTVTDISAAALARAQADLGERAADVAWAVGDIRSQDLGRRFDLWHDRAVFHFQVDPADRLAYVDRLRRGVAPGGHAIIATFGPDGPTSCSGLPVRRYGADELAAELGEGLQLEGAELVVHETPAGNRQQFLYTTVRRV